MNPLNHLRKLAGAVVEKSASGLNLWLLKRSCLDHIDGIAICDLSIPQDPKNGFLELTRQTMALIKSLDARRYRRVCRYLDYIVNTELISGGNFKRSLKICNIDYAKYITSANPQWNHRAYARLLIHEATHGLLSEKGIPSNKETREQIERLCNREEYRFALHFGSEYADVHPGPFNEAWYKWYWESSKQTKLTAWWIRIREALWADRSPSRMLAQSPSQELNGNAAMTGDFASINQFDPKEAQVVNERGVNYSRKGEHDKAITDYDTAIQLNPQFAMAYSNRGLAYHRKGKFDKALADCDQAILLDSQLAPAYLNRGFTYRSMGEHKKAIADYNHAIHLSPKDASTYKHLAWLLATCPEASFRDGKKAVKYATMACELSGWRDPHAVKTLAASFAEAGDFDNAVNWQSQHLRTPNLSSSEAAQAKSRLALYQARKSYHVDK